jgi:nanoRNase/pAp phosphatase (c-di-AMP/oligoRNAs hydrolase)
MAAAWIAMQVERTASIWPGRYGEDPPHIHQRDVYVVDFSYPRQIMKDMNELARSMVVLDHHISAQRECKDLDFCHFDLNKSGAGLTWDYFHGEKPRPKWIDRVEDRDLWKFNFEDTEVFHAYMSSFPISLKSCDQIHNTDFSAMIEDGRSIRRYIDNTVNKLVAESRIISFHGYRVAIANAPYQYASETAGILLDLYQDIDYAVCWFNRKDGKFQYSLRSHKSGTVDVSKIAAQFGGGGHKYAAGYTTSWLPTSMHQ